MVGLLLKKLRKASVLSRSAVAELVGVQRLSIYRWENLKNAPGFETAKKLASVLNGQMNWVCPHCGALHSIGEE